VVCCMLTAYLHCQLILSVSASSPWNEASNQQALDASLQYGDQPPSVFAPGGRLFSVDRTMMAVGNPEDQSSNLLVAIAYSDGVMLVSTQPLSPYMHYRDRVAHSDTEQNNSTTISDQSLLSIPVKSSMTLSQSTQPADPSTSSTISLPSLSEAGNEAAKVEYLQQSTSYTEPLRWLPPFTLLSSRVVGATGGNAVDSQIIRRRLHIHSESMREYYDSKQSDNDAELTPAVLARRFADECQLPTQQQQNSAGRRMLAVSIVLADHEQVWRIDPTGQFWKCALAVVGRQGPMAEAWLFEQLSLSSSTPPSSSQPLSFLRKVFSRASAESRHMPDIVGNLSEDEAYELVKRCIQHTQQVNRLRNRSPSPLSASRQDKTDDRILHLHCAVIDRDGARCFLDSCQLNG
jgi:20S proteasome alpha/beta subunit